MLQIALIRPGATEYDRQGRVQGTLDVPLSEEGRSEVAALIDQLRGDALDVIYCSPVESAEQTADAIGEALHVRVRRLDKLQNLNQGLWQGMLIDDVKLKQPKVYRQFIEKPETICPPEGESIYSARQRAEDVLGRLLKKHDEGQIALVVPEPMASIVRQVLRHDDLGDLWDTDRQAQLERIVVGPVAAVKS
jgi:broad specificity phosphatase PhoE